MNLFLMMNLPCPKRYTSSAQNPKPSSPSRCARQSSRMMFMQDIVVFRWTIGFGVCDIKDYAAMFIQVQGSS